MDAKATHHRGNPSALPLWRRLPLFVPAESRLDGAPHSISGSEERLGASNRPRSSPGLWRLVDFPLLAWSNARKDTSDLVTNLSRSRSPRLPAFWRSSEQQEEGTCKERRKQRTMEAARDGEPTRWRIRHTSAIHHRSAWTTTSAASIHSHPLLPTIHTHHAHLVAPVIDRLRGLSWPCTAFLPIVLFFAPDGPVEPSRTLKHRGATATNGPSCAGSIPPFPRHPVSPTHPLAAPQEMPDSLLILAHAFPLATLDFFTFSDNIAIDARPGTADRRRARESVR